MGRWPVQATYGTRRAANLGSHRPRKQTEERLRLWHVPRSAVSVAFSQHSRVAIWYDDRSTIASLRNAVPMAILRVYVSSALCDLRDCLRARGARAAAAPASAHRGGRS